MTRSIGFFLAMLGLAACTEIAARPEVDLAREMPADIALQFIRDYRHDSDPQVADAMKTYGCKYADASLTLNNGKTVKYTDVQFAPGLAMVLVRHYSVYVVLPGGLNEGWCMVTMLDKGSPKLQSDLNDLATAFNAIGTRLKPTQP